MRRVEDENSEEVKKMREQRLGVELIRTSQTEHPIADALRILSGRKTVISFLFPFTKFFADAPQPLFPSESHEADLEVAEGCFRPSGGVFMRHRYLQLQGSEDERVSRESDKVRECGRCLCLGPRYFENMFREIEECRAFELLRNGTPTAAESYCFRFSDHAAALRP